MPLYAWGAQSSGQRVNAVPAGEGQPAGGQTLSCVCVGVGVGVGVGGWVGACVRACVRVCVCVCVCVCVHVC
jgi:hypothetical protein